MKRNLQPAATVRLVFGIIFSYEKFDRGVTTPKHPSQQRILLVPSCSQASTNGLLRSLADGVINKAYTDCDHLSEFPPQHIPSFLVPSTTFAVDDPCLMWQCRDGFVRGVVMRNASFQDR